MNTIFVYEVDLRITQKATGQVKLVTRTEHAYSLMDALHQALIHASVDLGDVDVKPLRIGPPDEAIRAAAGMPAGLAATIAGLLHTAGVRTADAAKRPRSGDAVDPSAADPGTPSTREKKSS